MQNLRLHAIEDCFLTVFLVEDTYALLNGETIPGAHTATNSALRAYLTRCLRADDVGLELEVRIDEANSGGTPLNPVSPLYPFI